MPQIKASPKSYDVVVVGSGAGGGIAAHVLTLAGAKVCMLEAGGDYNTAKQIDMFKWNYDAPHRAAGSKEKPFGYYDATLVGGWQVPGEPYTSAPGSEFMWYRARMLGGRTNHYGRISLRMGPYDFKPYSRDGKGFDWPITYDDLAPYYDKAEELIGVFGTQEGLENTPDGRFQPAPAPRAHERIIKRVSDKLKIPCIPSRLAILTKPLNGRPACHYCAECGRACAVNANFASPGVHIAPAMATGNLEVRTGAMCREVMVGPDGRATGVSYIDTKTRREVTVNARVVVLAASCCETARIMMNSKMHSVSEWHRQFHGLVGKSIMDTVGSSVSGYLPILEDLPAVERRWGGRHAHVHAVVALSAAEGRARCRSRAAITSSSAAGAGCRARGFSAGRTRMLGGGYGKNLKRDIRKIYGASVYFAGRGEMIPNDESYCEIDPVTVDQWGIPVLRFHFKWSQDEILQAKHMQDTFRGNHPAAGGKSRRDRATRRWAGSRAAAKSSTRWALRRWATIRRPACSTSGARRGTARTCSSRTPRPFASNADKNPTLSITALGWRTSDYIADQIKKRNL